MNIRPGDLVMVVRPTPCCGNSGGVGHVYAVGGIESMDGLCQECGRKDTALVATLTPGIEAGFHVSRLIRIDPLSTPVDVTREEELTA